MCVWESCDWVIAPQPSVKWHTVYQESGRRAIFIHKTITRWYLTIVEQAAWKINGLPTPFLAQAFFIHFPSLSHTQTRTHSQLAHTLKTPLLPSLSAATKERMLHSDGEMMTMAHYPLPEEWIQYIQRLYVLISRQTGYHGLSVESMKSICITYCCMAEHTVPLKCRVNIHSVSCRTSTWRDV